MTQTQKWKVIREILNIIDKEKSKFEKLKYFEKNYPRGRIILKYLKEFEKKIEIL